MRVSYFENPTNVYRLALKLAKAVNHEFDYGFQRYAHSMYFDDHEVMFIVNSRLLVHSINEKGESEGFMQFSFLIYTAASFGDIEFYAKYELPNTRYGYMGHIGALREEMEKYMPKKYISKILPNIDKEKATALEDYLALLLLSLG